eukprot:gene32506-41267_t
MEYIMVETLTPLLYAFLGMKTGTGCYFQVQIIASGLHLISVGNDVVMGTGNFFFPIKHAGHYFVLAAQIIED